MKVEVKKISDTEVEIIGSIPAEDFAKRRDSVIKKLGDTLEIDGFRKGHIPESVLIAKVGEASILEDMAEMALGDAYPKIIIDEKIDAIGRPEITITKLVAGNPLEFKIKQVIMPKIKLPDYKKISTEAVVPPIGDATAEGVTDKDVEDVINEIRKSRKKNPADEAEVAPVLDDALAQSIGNFKDVEDLKLKIRENMTHEREIMAKSKRRQKIIDEILAKTDFTIPNVFVEREMDSLMAELKDDVTHMGMKFEDYLTHVKKSAEELREASKATAEKRAKSWIILAKIAEEEKIQVDRDLLEKETAKILEHYKGADPFSARSYVEGILRNEAVFKLLEG